MKHVRAHEQVSVSVNNRATVVVYRAIVDVPSNFSNWSPINNSVLRTVDPNDCFGIAGEIYLKAIVSKFLKIQ